MSEQKYGFVYLWFDRKHKRYYVGCRWGSINDGYVCSSKWMKQAYGNRPQDFKRRIIVSDIKTRVETYVIEQKFLDMIKHTEIKPYTEKPRYYNLCIKNNEVWHKYDDKIKSIGQKISESKKGKNTGPRDPSVGAAISAAKKGKQFSEEHKKKLSEAKIGTKQTDEQKAKRSLSMSQQWADGIRTNKKHK